MRIRSRLTPKAHADHAMASPERTDPLDTTLTRTPMPDWLIGELRSNHAGETGAVAIYDGVLAVSRDGDLRAFAHRHRASEARHLDLMAGLVPQKARSRLLPLWRLAGWVTGGLPALFGAGAVYRTVDHVERFVELHFQAQIDRLERENGDKTLIAVLRECCEEEAAHREEAVERQGPSEQSARAGWVQRLIWDGAWAWAIRQGSALAVTLARRF